MRQIGKYLALVGVLLAAACVMTDVDQITRDNAIIEGRGNAYVGIGDVERDMLKEAAQATVNAGYDYFVIEDASSGYKDSSTLLTPGYYSSTATGSAQTFGNTVMGSATSQGTYVPPSYMHTSKPRSQMRIRMFKGPVPAGLPNAYDARDLLSQYSETASAPEPQPAQLTAAAAASSSVQPSAGAAPKSRDDLEVALINWCTLAETPTNCGCFSRELSTGPNAISDPELYQLMV